MFTTSLLVSCLFGWPGTSAPQEPLRLGVLAREAAGSSDVPFVRGVRRAVDAINQGGGVAGKKLEVTFEPVVVAKDVPAAVDKLLQGGAVALVAPPETQLAAAAAQAAGAKAPIVAFDAAPAAVAAVIDRLLVEHLCMTRIAVVHDRDKPSREFAKLLAKPGTLSAPAEVLWELEVGTNAKKVAKQLAEARPELLVLDAEPAEAQQFLAEHLAGDALPVVLTPRAYGEVMLRQPRAVFAVHGLSPGQSATASDFRRDYERDHGVPGFGAAEGYEAVTALARALAVAPSREPAAVTAALRALTCEGVRGRYGFDKAVAAFAPPLGAWLVDDDRLVPYTPLVVPLGTAGTAAGDTKNEPRKPQTGIGVPFGTWRTRRFAWEDGSQWVQCRWADDPGFGTGTADLALLGLSTEGKAPIVDHLIKEELFARVLAITSTKYGRNEDGSAIPGKSLRICFGAHLDEKARSKKKQRLWPALFGGDHEGAGGEAFGTFCRVYTMFIRRTIFQKNALSPPVSAADREFLDGTYVFGSDLDKDKRSELIRALINGYAGSMGLTLAHEVGHLCGLGHVTSDPRAIMNVEEGSGIDYPEAKFCAESWELLVKQLGVVGETAARKR